MPNLEYIRTITGYNYELFDRLWDSIMQLDDEQFVQEVDYSHGSVRNQIIHAASTEGGWLRGLKDDPNARQFRLDPDDYPTRESAREIWQATTKDVKDYIASLDEQGLLYTPQGFGGPVWQVLAHLVNHGTDHRAQTLRILHEFGAPTFDQDMIYYMWNIR